MQNPFQSRGARSLGLIIVAALAFAVIGGITLTHAAVPDAVMWDWHYGMWNDGNTASWGLWGWSMMLFGLLWMALIIGLPIYLVYWLTTRPQTGGRTEDGALSVLREQYARGEIDEEEFDRRRARLTADDGRY